MLNQQTISSDVSSIVCQGPATITLQASQGFASYFLVANGTDTVQSWLQGDFMEGPVSFAPTTVNATTTFSVKARQQMSSKSLNFNGVDQLVEEPGFTWGNTFTIITWVYVNSTPPPLVYVPFITTSNFQIANIWLGLGGDRVQMYVNDALQLEDGNPIPTNQWVPIATSYNGTSGELNLYVNGNLVGNTNILPIFSSANGLMIAGDTWNTYLNGSMDHILIFNTALQQNQINDYVYNCVNPTTPGLVALYDFEEGMGNQTLNAATGMMADVLNVDMNSWFDGLWICGPVCDLDMANTVTVTVSNLPTEPFVAATPSFCDPGATTNISSPTSHPTANYYLIDDATSAIVDGPITGGGSVTFNTPTLNTTTNFSVHADIVSPSTGLEVFGEEINPGDDMNFTNATAEGWFKHNLSHTYSSDPGIVIVYNYDNVNDLPIEAIAINANISTGSAYLTNVNFPFPLPPVLTPSAFGATNILDGNWHHLAMVRDVATGTFTLYVDGNPETNLPSAANPWNGGMILSFDLTTFTGSVYGTYDDFRFWSEARSQADININKDDCLTGLETNLEGYWKMDDGTGTDIWNSAVNGNLASLSIDNNAVEGVDYAWTTGNTTCTVCENTVATVTVTVGDTEAPTVVCQNFSGQLDANGELTLATSNVVSSVNDNCDASPTVSLSTSTIDCSALVAPASKLIITGVVDGPLGGGTPKAIELYVQDDIADLSQYGIGSANNGGGTDGQEFTFPAVSVMSNTYIYIASESPNFTAYFGFAPTYTNAVANINGDDAIELFFQGNVVDVFGDISYASATGLPWLHTDGWAYRVNNTGPDGSTFNINNWIFSGVDANDGCTNNGSCASVMPIQTYSFQLMAKVPITVTATDASGNSSSCVAEVTVTDQIAPVISNVPADITVTTNNANCTAIVTWSEPTLSDNCGIHATMITHPSGSAFPIGTTIVEYHAADLSGNGTVATFSVTVNADLSATATAQDALCFDEASGNVTLNVTGGTAPYTYAWSNGATTQDLSNVAEDTYNVVVTDANGCTANASAMVDEPSEIMISATTVNPSSCGMADGEIDITVSGGTVSGAYSYSWNTGATTEDLTGLTGGFYEITVMDDNGCTATASGPLEDPNAPTLSINMMTSILMVDCFGDATGTIDLDVTLNGGATSATFDWSNSETTQNISGLTAGIYSVVVTDDNGCITGISQIIMQPNAVSGNTMVTPPTCNGDTDGAVNLTTNGGDGNYTYEWDDAAMSTTQDIMGLAAGTYTVMITDGNGCMGTAMGTVIEPAAVSGTIVAIDASCNGNTDGELDLTPTGGVGTYTYLWDNAMASTTQDISGLATGTYMVTITDGNGCTGTATGTVNEPAALTITATPTDITTGNNGTVSTTTAGGTAPHSYSWTGPGGFMSTDENLTGLGLMGLYEVTVTDANGCTATASGVVNNTTGLNSTQELVLTVFPNPSNGMFTVNSSISNGMIIVRDALGREIHNQQINSNTSFVNLENQSNGIYFMELRSGDVSKTVRVMIGK